jgi:RNA polymerase sigma factor (sigma-70 family)
MGQTTNLTLDELLGQSDWLARLAVHLAGPEHADDALQDTWLAARLSAPERGRSPRPWLAAVLRNQIRARWQRDTRRRRREEAAALLAADCEAAVDAVHERLEMQRLVAERVMALDRPLRTVVLLRYFEGRDSTEIAALLGIPAGTVRWRLKTALDRLRAELDHRFPESGGRSWALLLAPAAVRAGGSKVPGLATVLLALTAASGLVAYLGAARAVQRSGRTVATSLAPARPGPDRTAVPGGGAIEGRVLEDGRPVGGAFVVGSRTRRRAAAAPSIRWTRSDRDGRFQMLALQPGHYLLTAMGPEHGVAPARPVLVEAGDTAGGLDLSLAAAPAGLQGRVLDEGAGVIARARIRATSIGDDPDPVVFETQSVCLGRYRLELPAGPYAIEIEADGYAPVRFSIVLRSSSRRDFSLRPGARAAGRVSTQGEGQPVAGAALVARSQDDDREIYTTDADDEGSFVFAWLAPGTYDIEARWGDLVGRSSAIVVGEAARLEGIDLTVAPPDRSSRRQEEP